MPRHIISNAHEWMNEIPTVPTCYLAKPQPRERAWQNQRGKKTLFNPRVDPGVGNSTCAAGLQCMRCGRVVHTPPAHTPHFCLFRRRDPASLRSSSAQSPVLGAFAVFLRTSKFEKSRWHMCCTPALTVLARPPPSFCGGLKPAPAFTSFDSPIKLSTSTLLVIDGIVFLYREREVIESALEPL
ncbi:hypothetical protein F2P79_019047 [Pimephales promelas]|nr:hypothetical protein F2P79_019047 [Pimephales promelas]